MGIDKIKVHGRDYVFGEDSNSPLKVMTATGEKGIVIVDKTDPRATRMRIMTATGVKAWGIEQLLTEYIYNATGGIGNGQSIMYDDSNNYYVFDNGQTFDWNALFAEVFDSALNAWKYGAERFQPQGGVITSGFPVGSSGLTVQWIRDYYNPSAGFYIQMPSGTTSGIGVMHFLNGHLYGVRLNPFDTIFKWSMTTETRTYTSPGGGDINWEYAAILSSGSNTRGAIGVSVNGILGYYPPGGRILWDTDLNTYNLVTEAQAGNNIFGTGAEALIY